MTELQNQELIKIEGGIMTSSLINAITKAAMAIYEFGQRIGSTIRRIKANSYCSL